MNKPYNEYAFPSHGTMSEVAYQGMTLRDWLAGQALPAVIQVCVPAERLKGEDMASLFARKAYEVADAALVERAKP